MKGTKKLALSGLLIALVAVGTIVIKVPTVATNGYIHIGDSMIYLAALLFGPEFGLIAAGLGSALADLLAGYTHWILPTLIIKGIEGFIIGKIAFKKDREASLRIRDIIAVIIGGSWMIGGYFVAGAILKSSWIAALDSVMANIVQAVGGAIIAFPLIFAILRSNLLEAINGE